MHDHVSSSEYSSGVNAVPSCCHTGHCEEGASVGHTLLKLFLKQVVSRYISQQLRTHNREAALISHHISNPNKTDQNRNLSMLSFILLIFKFIVPF